MPVITALLWQGGRPRQTIPRSWWAKQPGLHGGEQQKIRDEDSHRYYALTSTDIMACVCLLSWMLMHIINTHKHICIHAQKEAIFFFTFWKMKLSRYPLNNFPVCSALSLALWQVKYLQAELCDPLYNLFELQSVCFNYLLWEVGCEL